MNTSIRNELKKSNLNPENTAYADAREEFLDYEISSGDFFECIPDHDSIILSYKRKVTALTMEMVSSVVPELSSISFTHTENQPFFACNLAGIADALRCGRKIAVEGGPCLFGLEEVYTRVSMADGQNIVFDFSTGKRWASKADSAADSCGLPDSPDDDLIEYIVTNGASIKDIDFINQKKGVTTQEYDSIYILFSAARALKAMIVLPLPDMSYQKYMDYATRDINPALRDKAMTAFSHVTHQVSDLYINITEKIASEFPDVEYTIVHDRDRELCLKYYEKRRPFIERNKILRILTPSQDRLESVKDYISMPALPFYLFGITDILQIDSLDETDSYRKCQKAHKGTINLCALMYPERISADGKNTIYNTSSLYKEYL